MTRGWWAVAFFALVMIAGAAFWLVLGALLWALIG